MMDRAGLDIAQGTESVHLLIICTIPPRISGIFFVEIYRNREFYRTQDVRPPFTYASLIRQVGNKWRFVENNHNLAYFFRR